MAVSQHTVVDIHCTSESLILCLGSTTQLRMSTLTTLVLRDYVYLVCVLASPVDYW